MKLATTFQYGPTTLKPKAWPFPKEQPAELYTKTPMRKPIKEVTLVEIAQMQDIRLCHIQNIDSNKGGATIAYRKTGAFKNTRMVEVAIAFCSPHDVFNKKIGNERAISNFLDGQTVLLPVRNNGNDYSIVYNLKEIFEPLIYRN